MCVKNNNNPKELTSHMIQVSVGPRNREVGPRSKPNNGPNYF
jgi:hypothetical protein